MRDTEFEQAMERHAAITRQSATVALTRPQEHPLLSAVFDADQLWNELATDLPKALRKIADALEAKALEGRMVSVDPHGLVNDDRVHLRVALRLSAPVRRDVAVRGSEVADGAL